MSLGEPAKPLPDVSWDGVEFVTLEPKENSDFKVFITSSNKQHNLNILFFSFSVEFLH